MNFFFKLLILFFFSSISYSSEKLVYIDFDLVIKNTIAGKKIIKNIQEIEKTNFEIIKKDQQLIIEKEKEIKNLKNIISKEEVQKKINALQNDIKNFNINKKKLNDNFLTSKNELIKNFFDEITPIVEKYMVDNSISIVIDKKNIFIARSKNEITNEIIELINK